MASNNVAYTGGVHPCRDMGTGLCNVFQLWGYDVYICPTSYSFFVTIFYTKIYKLRSENKEAVFYGYWLGRYDL